jgi:sugar/nucleoside kinase (ribokinase family)
MAVTVLDRPVLVIGDYYVDLVFAGLPQWVEPGTEVFATETHTLPGGAFTHARALHRLEVPTAWAAVLGNDPYSRVVLDAAHQEGLDTTAYRVHDYPIRNVSVAASYQGERGFISYKEPPPRHDIAAIIDKVSPAAILIVEMTTGSRLATIADAARAHRAELLMDPQHIDLTLDAAATRAAIETVDVFLPNAAEARQLTGCPDVGESARRLAEVTQTVVVKDGARGGLAAQAHTVLTATAPRVEVVDTIGAGDCFDAGYVAGHVMGLNLADRLQLAVTCGSISTTSLGGTAAPTLAQLAEHDPPLPASLNRHHPSNDEEPS